MHHNKKRLSEGQAGEQVCFWGMAWNHIPTAMLRDNILYAHLKMNRRQANRKSFLQKTAGS